MVSHMLRKDWERTICRRLGDKNLVWDVIHLRWLQNILCKYNIYCIENWIGVPAIQGELLVVGGSFGVVSIKIFQTMGTGTTSR